MCRFCFLALGPLGEARNGNEVVRPKRPIRRVVRSVCRHGVLIHRDLGVQAHVNSLLPFIANETAVPDQLRQRIFYFIFEYSQYIRYIAKLAYCSLSFGILTVAGPDICSTRECLETHRAGKVSGEKTSKTPT